MGDEIARRAVHYLLDTQQESGLWPTDVATATLLPPDQLYVNPVYGQCLALESLVRHARGSGTLP